MELKKLGLTDIKVSELCFGALPIGPLQANMSPEDGGVLIRQALEMGINFIDTAQSYKTYEHIRRGIEGFTGDLVIASKCMAEDYAGMEKAIQEALESLQRDYIDIFHLHAAMSSTDVFEKREQAMKCLLDYKQKGYIRAVGIATHDVEVVELAASISEIDIVYPLINKKSRGILKGNAQDMIKAINKCHETGKGTYAMKVLAGGNLIGDLFDAVSFVRNIDGIDAVSMGIINSTELELNVKIFSREITSQDMLPNLVSTKKIFVAFLCKKCGLCLEACPNEALSMDDGDRAVVDHEKCILCGYCYPVCPEFAIRMI